MTEANDLNPLEPVQQTIKMQVPQLEDDLQRAIDSLRKLQSITGTLTDGRPDAPVRLDLRAGNLGGGAPARSILEPDRAPVSKQVRILVTGESFGRYQITRPLGKGAMGAVYLAYDPQLQRYVALKTPFLGDNPQVVQRFFREARSAAQIRSPYVCPIYEVDNVAGILYLSMAFIEGQSLAKWIHGEVPHTLDEIVTVFRKISLGMQKAHSQGIIHRDLKPENVMIDPDAEPIIMDFGLARRVNDEIKVTAAGGLLGTPAYMSPEQVGGDQDQIGPQSDLYSLGVVLYEMLTGTLPFSGSLMTVLHKIIHEEPVPPSVHQPNLPSGSPIERVCLKMMAKRQSDRYQNVGEVLAELEPTAAPNLSAPIRSRSLFKSMWEKSGRILASMVGKAPAANASIAMTLDQGIALKMDPSIASTMDPGIASTLDPTEPVNT